MPSGDEWWDLPPISEAAWLSQEPGRSALGKLAIDHVGVAVHDVDEAIERFRKVLGLHHWVRSTFYTDAVYHGVEQRVGGHVALTDMGSVKLELVQPIEGTYTPVDVLNTRGEGLYHIGFRVPDVAASLIGAEDAGFSLVDIGKHGNIALYGYSDSELLCGVTLEVVGPSMPAEMITAVREIQ